MTPDPVTAPSPTDLRLSLLRAADGDAHLAEALRQMMWDDYCRAGQPFGPDEEAMWAWWAYGQQTTAH